VRQDVAVAAATVMQMPDASPDQRIESKGDFFKFQLARMLKKHHFLRRPLPVSVLKEKKSLVAN
jgi:hypothetical protein